MIAVFLYMACYDVTVLQCYTFVKDFNNSSAYPKEFNIFLKKLFIFKKKSEGAFCNTPSLEYQIMKDYFKSHDELRVLPHKWR